MNNTTLTPRQAAQQHNRDRGGRYAEKLYSEDGDWQAPAPKPAPVVSSGDLLCRQCGEPMEVTGFGVAHHLHVDGGIDYKADADHVAFLDESVDAPVEPVATPVMIRMEREEAPLDTQAVSAVLSRTDRVEIGGGWTASVSHFSWIEAYTGSVTMPADDYIRARDEQFDQRWTGRLDDVDGFTYQSCSASTVTLTDQDGNQVHSDTFYDPVTSRVPSLRAGFHDAQVELSAVDTQLDEVASEMRAVRVEHMLGSDPAATVGFTGGGHHGARDRLLDWAAANDVDFSSPGLDLEEFVDLVRDSGHR